MAVYRNISQSFWTDSKVADDFTPEDKYLYLYLLTNPYTNLCGCYEISVRQMTVDTGYNAETILRLLERLEVTHKVVRYSQEHKEILIVKWAKYNWTKSDKLDKPLKNAIDKIKCPAFRAFVAVKYNERDTVRIPYPYGIDTGEKHVEYPMDTTDTDTDTDTVPDTVSESGTETNGEQEPPTLSPDTLPRSLIEYCQKYLSELTYGHYEELRDVLEHGVSDELVKHAIDEAKANGVDKWAYVRRTLDVWLSQGIQTADDARAAWGKRKNGKTPVPAKETKRETV